MSKYKVTVKSIFEYEIEADSSKMSRGEIEFIALQKHINDMNYTYDEYRKSKKEVYIERIEHG